MTGFGSTRRAGRRIRLLAVSLVLILLMAVVAAPAPAQGVPDKEAQPTDAESTPKLEPVVLSEVRSGDVTTITLEIPAGADTFTSSGRPTTNWSNDPNLRVGFNQTLGLGAERIFLFFDMSSIPANATVQSANLRAFLNSSSPSGDRPMGLMARFLSSPWDASILTWNNYNPSWGAEIGVDDIPANFGWIEASVTRPVREWVSGTRPNFGLMIQGDETPQQRERIFTALDARNGQHPRIVVTYQIDTTPPTSRVAALPQWSPATFNVSWDGQDNPGGSGIHHFDIQFRVNGGGWQNWQMATSHRSASFTGTNGNLYEFRSRAIDNAGNIEGWPGSPEAGTTVDTVPPNASVNPLPPFTFSNTFNVTWGGTDTGSGPNGGSGIYYFDVEFQLNGGPWQPFATRTTTMTGTVVGAQPGQVYGFRARAVDPVGNVQPFPAIAQAQTTISLGNPTANIVPFSSPITTQATFNVQWRGQAPAGSMVASYDVQFRVNGGVWQSWLSGFNGTSSQFTATFGDGVYEFQVRARDTQGRVGQFSGGRWASIAVDTEAPFVIPQSYYPIIADN